MKLRWQIKVILKNLLILKKIKIKDPLIIHLNNLHYEKYTTCKVIIETGTKTIKREMFNG